MFKNLDPRTKIVLVLCLSTLGVFIQNVFVLGAVLLVSAGLSMIIGGKLGSVLKVMARIWYIFLILILIQSIFAGSGNVLLSLGNFPVLTTGGIIKGAEFLLRLLIIIVSATIVTTSSYREIIQGLTQWKMPYEIAFMVSIAIRFLPLLTAEVKNTITAIQLRGIEMEKLKFPKRTRLYYYIFMPVVINTVKKAQKLSIAMEARAFRAYPRRTTYLILRFSGTDYFITLGILIFTGASMFVYFYLLN